MSIVTIDSIVKQVLAQANKEQNQHWPPHIIQQQFITVTNYILDRVVELFPGNNGIVDIARPFLRKQSVIVVGGKIPFPEKYRNFLGAAIMISKDKKSLCSEGVYKNDPLKKTDAQVERMKQKGDCESNPITMLDQDEWDSRTKSRYKFPTYEKPIGCIFEGDGIKVCPFDIGTVELRYLIEPKEYVYAYTMLPDDTYVADPATTVESEWEKNASKALFKGMLALYAAYVKDAELRNWNTELGQIGLF